MGQIGKINIIGLHHISLSVTNLDKCKHFYGHVLGLKEIKRPNFNFNGAWYQLGDQQLHLIVHPDSNTLRKKEHVDTKDGHLAIRVANYDEAVKHLKEHNVPFMENHGSKSGFVQVFCLDPSNNLIELNIESEKEYY
ncbi:VOC family protein [Lederbergia panacisoli]|uniref:VOC family protein n=1 Tax=Lederbergia panacisoli TaxID=1255251 RepID=UPI00214CDFC1|nr:VOC family protein [Lederbergia panacisoli]MCR2820909.1 VOC family protein [Lederbergia panacisoli]